MESLWKPPLPAGLVVDTLMEGQTPPPRGPAALPVAHVPLAASNERHKKVDNVLNFLCTFQKNLKKGICNIYILNLVYRMEPNV